MNELLLGFLFVVAGIAASTAGLIAVRRWVPLSELKENHGVGGIILGVVAQTYAVLLAFVVVVVWSAYNDIEATSTQEAAHAGSMYWLAQALPEDDRRGVRETLSDYVQAVVSDEWPLMARGEESQLAWERHDELWQELDRLTPETPQEIGVRDQLLEEMRQLDESRRRRLLNNEQRIPNLMWVVLVGGGVSVLLFTYVFGTKQIWVQALMTGILVGLFGLILFLIAALDEPFSGYLKLQPSGFQSLLQLMGAIPAGG